MKWDKTAEAAIEQIKKNEYVDSLKDYTGEAVLVGINYTAKDNKDSGFKRHTCRIEKVII